MSNDLSGVDDSPDATPSAPPITAADFELNPELYGLRRSRRAHHVPDRFSVEADTRSTTYAESSDENENASRRRRQRKNRKNKKQNGIVDDDDDDDDAFDGVDDDEDDFEDDDDDEEVFATSKRAKAFEKAQAKKRRKLHKKSEDSELNHYAPQMRFSTRNNKVVNYSIDDDDDDFEDYVTYKEHELPAEAYQEELTGPGKFFIIFLTQKCWTNVSLFFSDCY